VPKWSGLFGLALNKDLQFLHTNKLSCYSSCKYTLAQLRYSLLTHQQAVNIRTEYLGKLCFNMSWITIYPPSCHSVQTDNFKLFLRSLCRYASAKQHIYLKNAVFWDVAPCRSCVNRRFGGTIVYIFRVEKSASEVAAHAVSSLADCLPWRWRWYVLRNIGSHKIYTAPHPRRLHSS
jgi:hypothetical protein